ncbi:zinc ribbon domain-containing protein [Mediterraneibacter gnavus]|uniref:zinc ribbon domain-containing protein n=1 Tax=Mediterraneibacter gnavus TaxID=33038 RepID=UPI0032B74DF3
MICPKCNADNSDGAKFCSQCGIPLERKEIRQQCLNCGEELDEDYKFCSKCGRKIDESEQKLILEENIPSFIPGERDQEEKSLKKNQKVIGIFAGLTVLAIIGVVAFKMRRPVEEQVQQSTSDESVSEQIEVKESSGDEILNEKQPSSIESSEKKQESQYSSYEERESDMNVDDFTEENLRAFEEYGKEFLVEHSQDTTLELEQISYSYAYLCNRKETAPDINDKGDELADQKLLYTGYYEEAQEKVSFTVEYDIVRDNVVYMDPEGISIALYINQFYDGWLSKYYDLIQIPVYNK